MKEIHYFNIEKSQKDWLKILDEGIPKVARNYLIECTSIDVDSKDFNKTLELIEEDIRIHFYPLIHDYYKCEPEDGLNNFVDDIYSYFYQYLNDTSTNDLVLERKNILFNSAIPNLTTSFINPEEKHELREFFHKLKEAEIILDKKEIFKTIKSISELKTSIIIPEPQIQIYNPIDSSIYQRLLNHPELLKTLDWRKFEYLLGDILETFGYSIEITKATRDGGIDIIGITKDHLGEQRHLIQAKRYNASRISLENIHSLLFLKEYYKATKGCLATTTFFSKEQWHLANIYRYQLELKDFDGVMAWIKQAAHIKGINTIK